MNEEKEKNKTCPGRLECTEPAWGEVELRGLKAERQSVYISAHVYGITPTYC